MNRVRAEKKYNTFVQGLITEANPLTYPENASLDEDNFVLKRDGSRERRLGVDFEAGHTMIPTGIAAASIASGRQSFHKWENPGGDSSVSIGVVRVGPKLWFMDLLTESPSSNLLNSGNAITLPLLDSLDIETAVVNNYLIIVGGGLSQPVALYYTRATQGVGYSYIPIQVRDLWGISDGLNVRDRPVDLSILHEYNLRNQGWNPAIKTSCDYVTYEYASSFYSDTGEGGLIARMSGAWVEATSNPISVGVLKCTKDTLGVYPSNADIWTLGKVSDSSSANFEKYDPAIMARNAFDSMAAPKGSFIIDAFNRGYSRGMLTGLVGLPLDWEKGKLSTVASYAGRVFYAGVESNVSAGDGRSPNFSNTIFFSQIVTDSSKLGMCYQEADPTSENISDLIDTDGGVIHIPEATKIVKLIATRTSLLIFAENGVWELFGDTQGFVATSYQVSKISSNGCSSPRSVVEAAGTVFAWTKAGIYMYAVEPTSGRYSATSASLQSIQTLYNGLSELTKDYARGFYDEKENTVRWLFNDLESYSDTSYVNRYNRELVFDITLQAFYPQSIDTTVGPYISDYADIPSYTIVTNNEEVYVGATQVYAGTDAVLVESEIAVSRTSQFSFLVISNTSITLGKYNNRNFKDWQGYDGVGKDYLSYLLTGYENFGSVGSKKQVPYIWMHFRKTETGFSEIEGQLELDNPSSCLVQAQWDWTNSADSGKWGNQFQAYKLLRPYTPTGTADQFDYGHEVIMTKNKLRGSGKSLSLLIQSETGKDMKLLGWSLLVEVGR